MDSIPQPKNLRTLTLIEVYEFYDKPILFSCVDDINTIFMVVLIEESDEIDTWLYAPISKSRFSQIRAGQIDLHDTFAHVENNLVYRVTIPYTDTLSESFKPINVNSLESEIFPMPGEYLNLNTPLNLPKSSFYQALESPQNPFHLDSSMITKMENAGFYAQRTIHMIPTQTKLPIHFAIKNKKKGR